MIKLLLSYFIFPGMAFISIAGMFASYLDRKITARIHWRVGPSLKQPYYDIKKLLIKETILPANGPIWLFVSAPLISFLSVALISDIMITSWFNTGSGFIGDTVVIFYLFAIPAVASILGAFASQSPYASLGASREIKLLIAYEVPLFLAMLVPIIKAQSVLFGKIISAQVYNGSFAASASGLLALIVAIFCIQAKMGFTPFDLAEAETELAGGTQAEYSGPLLAVWKLSKMALTVAAPLFLVMLFWGAGGWLIILLKYIFLLIVAVLIKNTNPRVKINQAMKFFLGPVSIAAVVAVLLAWKGY
ncbi:MAG: hypothetical protein A2204_04295 [Elusimicrobia bacterium RIFOXYA1_FULL_47_7]|nr:MAG: hypothetical protein A2204_04295 [Elusimicrobia bacterium RIFOXYA1_FULL_47_7]